MPGYEANTWFGLAAPGGTPREIVMKINAEVRKILAEPAFQARFMAPQMFESMATSPDEFAQFIKRKFAELNASPECMDHNPPNQVVRLAKRYPLAHQIIGEFRRVHQPFCRRRAHPCFIQRHVAQHQR